MKKQRKKNQTLPANKMIDQVLLLLNKDDVYSYFAKMYPVFKSREQYNRYKKELMVLLLNNGKLLEYDIKTLVMATVEAYERGFSFDPRDAEVYFIPYNGSIEMQIGYRGVLKELFKRPDVKDVIVNLVYEGDEINITYDSNGRLVLNGHRPNLFNRDPENIIGGYALVHYQSFDGVVSNGVFMTAKQIEKVREEFSKSDKVMGDKSFWKLHKEDMYKKTLLKRVAKVLPPLPKERIMEMYGLADNEMAKLLDDSGLTQRDIKGILYNRYGVYSPNDLSKEQLAEFKGLLKEKGGRVVSEDSTFVGEFEEREIQDLAREKRVIAFLDTIKKFLGIDPFKRLMYEDYRTLKEYLQKNDKDKILDDIGENQEEYKHKGEDLLRMIDEEF